MPKFAHLSLFIKKGGGKLSKREGATSLLNYRDQGYLPEAVSNFMAFLGWNPKDTREKFSLKELEGEFDLKNVNKANPIFDTEKLDYLNGVYLREMDLDKFVDICIPFMEKEIKSDLMADREYVKKVLALEQERVKKLDEIGEYTKYFFIDDAELKYDKEILIWKKDAPEKIINNLEKLIKKLTEIEEANWSGGDLEKNIIDWIKNNDLSNGEILFPMRAALSGQTKSPSPFEIADVLGKNRVINRLQIAISSLQK